MPCKQVEIGTIHLEANKYQRQLANLQKLPVAQTENNTALPPGLRRLHPLQLRNKFQWLEPQFTCLPSGCAAKSHHHPYQASPVTPLTS